MAYAGGPTGTLFAEGGSGPLRLLGYLILAVFLMVVDHRGGHLAQARAWLSLLNEPIYRIASLPGRTAVAIRDAMVTRERLAGERDTLLAELLVARAQLARLDDLQRENARLRELLGGTRGLELKVQLARLADIDLDPFRHRLLLDRGARDGLVPGLALIDARGLVGQVVEVGPLRSTALLVSDPSHAVPVQVQRSGLRTIAFGTGDLDRLVVPNIPQSADIRVGDLLLTSGLGGGFPAGLQVARVTRLLPDDTRLFVVAEAAPVAALDRSGEVLLVWEVAEAAALEAGPPAPEESVAPIPPPPEPAP